VTTTALPAAPAGWLLPFAATLIAMFALQLSNLGFSPLLPSIQQEFGMSYTQLGLFTGLYGLLAMLLSVPAGVGARRLGEKRVLGLGLLGVAAGSVLLGEAWSFESALTFRGLTIFGYRFAFVSVLIAVALTAPASLRWAFSARPQRSPPWSGLRWEVLWSASSAGALPSLVTRRWPCSARLCSGCSTVLRPMTRRASTNADRTALAAGARFCRRWSGCLR
jgi:MFS family permease